MKWNGRYYRPGYGIPVYPKKEQSIADLLKPLGEKEDKGNVWRPILNQPINVFKEAPTPTPPPSSSPTPTPTPTNTPTPSTTPPSFDPDYQAILTYATTQGYTLPSASGQTLQNALVVSLKNTTIWNDLDVLYITATDGDKNFSEINWINPGTHERTDVGVNPSIFTINQGIKNGSANITDYVDTNYNPFTQGVNYTQNDASIFAWTFSDLGSGFGTISGRASDAFNRWQNRNVNGHRINCNTALPVTFNNSGTGFKMIQRTSSTDTNLFNNSSTPTNFSITSTGIMNSNVSLFRSGNNNGDGLTLSVWGIGASLTGKETDLLNSLSSYMTSI